MSFRRYSSLVKSSGFQSFLWTQFLGAFNDNAYKIVLSMAAVNIAGDSGAAGGYVSLAGAVFILPFFFFSGYAGYLADAFNKRTVLIVTKSFEIAAVGFSIFAFVSGRIEIMFAGLFLMAAHSAFFSPAKYGILPEMTPYRELSAANGLVEMTTFFAIILGTSAGTVLFSAWKESLGLIGVFLLVVAVVGTAMSFGVPKVAGPLDRKHFSLNPWREISVGLKRLCRQRLLLLTVLGITYFWFLGALLQMDLLLLGKEVMHLTDLWIGFLITFLAVGIGAGSIAAGRLSGGKVEPGLVPLGSIGMGLFTVFLARSVSSYAWTAAFLSLIGFSGGLFIVPLNALLQRKSAPDERGRIIATNNFLNTGGILLASIMLWFMRDYLNMQADRIMLIFGLLTVAFTALLVKALPDFSVRFIIWAITHTLYKIRINGRENIPERGPALLVSNHVSFVDGLLVGACAQRFIRFMVHDYFCELKPIRSFMRLMKVIPVAGGGRREAVQSIKRAREELKAGHVVCIFAEGEITRTGNLRPFKRGFEKIAEGQGVPVIPVHLDRVWGSLFSFNRARFFSKLPDRFPLKRPVTVSFGSPMKAPVRVEEVRQAVQELGSHAFGLRIKDNDTLQTRFMRIAKRRFFSLCMADSTGAALSYGQALAGGIMLSRRFGKGLPEEDFIGLMLPSTVAGVLANIAVLIAGKTPVNLNFTAGREAISEAIRQCGIKTIITSRTFLAKAGLEEREGMVFLEDAARAVSGVRSAFTYVSALLLPAGLLGRIYFRGRKDSGSLAAVIFTSGSSGAPKGVMLTHRNILANIEGFSQIFHLTKKDTLMGVLPFFHSFGFTATIWFPFLNGFPAVYHPNPLDAKTVGEMSVRHRATVIMATPAFFSAYAKKCAPGQFKTIRYAVTGAEKLRPDAAREFKEKFGIDLLEGYGCTEMSPVVSVNVPDAVDGKIRQQGRVPGTVGAPIPGVAVKVVCPEKGTPLPHGSAGLLLVSGPNRMTGYLKDRERTEEVFKDGWYITGDIASISPDGFITITDRMTRFSKIGGEMVPHCKVEETIAAITGGASVVASVPDEERGERLVAFHTCPKTGAHDLWEGLLKSGLPRLWIPKKGNIHRIDAIPMTAAGKVDLKKIKEMARELTAKDP
ncbi:MAG: MFS transporter [Deltaproteobacteria bacterium]|nr:MFS transporter [Deltaproteobacteria bacterium]